MTMQTARRPARALIALTALAIGAGACIGNIGGDADGAADPNGSNQQGLCEDGSVKVAPSPMRRLTQREYNNAVRDLLGDQSQPAADFVPDAKLGGFDANAIAAASKLQLQQYLHAAETLAASAVSERLDTLARVPPPALRRAA
jgi:hypothetical protein